MADNINMLLRKFDGQIRADLRQGKEDIQDDPYFAVEQVMRAANAFDKYILPEMEKAGMSTPEIRAGRTDYLMGLYAGKFPEKDLFDPREFGVGPGKPQGETRPENTESFVAPASPELFMAFGSMDGRGSRLELSRYIRNASSGGVAGLVAGASRAFEKRAIGLGQAVATGLGGPPALRDAVNAGNKLTGKPPADMNSFFREKLDEILAPNIYAEAYLQSAEQNKAFPSSAYWSDALTGFAADTGMAIAATKGLDTVAPGVEAMRTSMRSGRTGALAVRPLGRAITGAVATAPIVAADPLLPEQTLDASTGTLVAAAGGIADATLGGMFGHVFDRLAKTRLTKKAAQIPHRDFPERIDRAIYSPETLIKEGELPLGKAPKNRSNKSVLDLFLPDPEDTANTQALEALQKTQQTYKQIVNDRHEEIVKPIEKVASEVLRRSAKTSAEGLVNTPAGADINDLTSFRNAISDLSHRFDDGLDAIEMDSPVMKFVRTITEAEPSERGFGVTKNITKPVVSTGRTPELSPEKVLIPGERPFVSGVDAEGPITPKTVPTLAKEFTWDSFTSGKISGTRAELVKTRPYIDFSQGRTVRKVLSHMSADEALTPVERKVAGQLYSAFMDDYAKAAYTLSQRADITDGERLVMERVLPELQNTNKMYSETVAHFNNAKGASAALAEYLDSPDLGGRNPEDIGDVIVSLLNTKDTYAKELIALTEEQFPGFKTALGRGVLRRALRAVGPEDIPFKGRTLAAVSPGDAGELLTHLGYDARYESIFDAATSQRLRILGKAFMAADEWNKSVAAGSRNAVHSRAEGLTGKGGKSSKLGRVDLSMSQPIFEGLPTWLGTQQGQRALAEVSSAIPTEANAAYNNTRLFLGLRDLVQAATAAMAGERLGTGAAGAELQARAKAQNAAAIRNSRLKQTNQGLGLPEFLNFPEQISPEF